MMSGRIFKSRQARESWNNFKNVGFPLLTLMVVGAYGMSFLTAAKFDDSRRSDRKSTMVILRSDIDLEKELEVKPNTQRSLHTHPHTVKLVLLFN
jgi:hypothetical protein